MRAEKIIFAIDSDFYILTYEKDVVYLPGYIVIFVGAIWDDFFNVLISLIVECYEKIIH